MNIRELINPLGHSSEFSTYIKSHIGEAKSKEEEDWFVIEDIEKIKEEITWS